MNTDNAHTSYDEALSGVKGICKIPARLTGFFSLVIQLVALLIVIAMTILIFMHVGGITMLRWNNSTTNEDLFPTAEVLQTNNLLLGNTSTDYDNNMTDLSNDNSSDFNEQTTTPSTRVKVYEGPFEQIAPLVVRIGQVNLNTIAVLRCSCLLYLSVCVLWLLSVICLGLSIRYEILDLVYINTFVLTIVIIYTLVQAVLSALLTVYQKEYNWPILLVLAATTGAYILSFIFGCCSLVLLVIWYRYTDYMSGSTEACMCTSSIMRFIKSRRQRRRQQQAGADYTIPEATHHANLPYIDELPVQQFSNF